MRDNMDIEQVIAHLTSAVLELHDRTTLLNVVNGSIYIAIKTMLLATHNDTEKARRMFQVILTEEIIERVASESFYIELIDRELH